MVAGPGHQHAMDVLDLIPIGQGGNMVDVVIKTGGRRCEMPACSLLAGLRRVRVQRAERSAIGGTAWMERAQKRRMSPNRSWGKCTDPLEGI